VGERDEAESYIRAPAFGGWSFLKQVVLNARREGEGYRVALARENGLVLEYRVEGGRTELVSGMGIHNVGPEGPGGQYHLGLGSG